MTKPDIAAFVGSRLDEDDAAARAALGWTAAYSSEDKDFAERFSPARALREIAALRAIVQWCIPDASVETALENGDVSVEDYVAHKTVGAHMLRHAAAIWQDHPDYDERWKP